jgi:hypothetical protein
MCDYPLTTTQASRLEGASAVSTSKSVIVSLPAEGDPEPVTLLTSTVRAQERSKPSPTHERPMNTALTAGSTHACQTAPVIYRRTAARAKLRLAE